MIAHRVWPCACLSLIVACSAAQAPAPKAEPETPALAAPDPLAHYALPTFPFQRDAASVDFRRGLERAERFLSKPLAVPPEGADQPSFEAWLKGDMVKWLTSSAKELDQIQRALGPVAEGDAAEATVASTLVALCWQRVHDHFVALPTPPDAAGDEVQEQHYRDGLEQAGAQWLRQATGTYAFCANRAKQDGTAALAPWLAYCSERYGAAMERMAALQQKMTAALEAQAEAARGPRPPGSQACWTPSQGRGPARAERPIQTPAPALVVLDIAEPGRVPLIGPERDGIVTKLTDVLAKLYADAGVEVRWLGAKQRRKLESDWRRGKQVAGGATCARGVRWLDFLRASHPNLELASAWSHCEGERCELQVDLGDRGAASVLGYRRLKAALAPPLSQADHWQQALEALSPVSAGDAAALLGGLGRRWRGRGGEPVTLHRFELHGEWPDGDAARSAVTSCGLGDCTDAKGGQNELAAVLDVDSSGRVAQVWQPPRLDTGRTQARCVAKALSAMRFAEGKGLRRVGLTFGLGRGQGQTPRDAAYGALDLATGVRVSVASSDNLTIWPTPFHDAGTESALAACFDRYAGEPSAPLALRASVQVGKNGKPRKASVQALDDAQGPLDNQLGRCLTRALGRAAFDCSSDGKPATVEATVCMVREPSDAPIPPAASDQPAETGAGAEP